jgi:hypothetical protein
MIVIREVFVAKPGMAGKMAKMMKSVMQGMANFQGRVLTDMTGQFNRVVLETELDNLSAFEQRMKDYAQNASLREKMSGYAEMYKTGKREIFQII